MRNFTVLLFIWITMIGCKHGSKVTDKSEEESYTESGSAETSEYADGVYCAEVEYYYSETGTNSTYTLSVEIQNNLLVRIDWPNGGWLDDTHFTPPDIEDGTAEFTSDRGVDYTVRILGEEGSCSLSSSAIDEDSLIDQHREYEYREEHDAQEEENRLREEEKQEERDREEQERQAEELEQSEEQVFTGDLRKDRDYYNSYNESAKGTSCNMHVPFLVYCCEVGMQLHLSV